MHLINKLVIYLVTCGFGLLLFYNIKLPESHLSSGITNETQNGVIFNYKHFASALVHKNRTTQYNVWCIFAKVDKNSELKSKFNMFVTSLLKHASVPLHLHIISDKTSATVADTTIRQIISVNKKKVLFSFYDVHDSAEKISDIVKALTPHFSSQPGSYYSDALFYISMGLHRIAPSNMYRAVLIDCDVKIKGDIKELFQEFNKFKGKLFGLAPELTPVYRHVLYQYRQAHPETTFGSPYKRSMNNTGFPGYNSGVVLLNLQEIRGSKKYLQLLTADAVRNLTDKYYFRGHLGDQDYYTILGYEYPELFRTIDCTWNRQLCTWWKDRGYVDVFDEYFYCPGDVKLYHGNCNTNIP